MTGRRKILILASQTGGAHVSLAEALCDLLQGQYTLEINDPQPFFFHWHYRMVSRYALWLWSAEFRLSNRTAPALLAHRLFTRLVTKPLTALLDRFQPDLIITTYPFFTYEVMQVLEGRNAQIPLVMLFADPHSVHASWLTERRAAAILAPTRETYIQALNAGFAEERLHLVGWTVQAQFSSVATEQRPELLKRLGLDPARFTVFLQGGGDGAAHIGRTVKRVLQASPDLQVILATGTNQRLLKRFRSIPNLYALPFTREIAPFMAAADVVMGKAGPNMLFEAVTLGKPFIATSYIPGQEEGNLEFIRRHWLGWVALKPKQQHILLQKLVAKQSELEQMKQAVAVYRGWNMSINKTIVSVIEDLFMPEN